MQITKNFNLIEFVKDSSVIKTLTVEQIINICRIAFELQKLRDELGKPIKINSAFRSPSHNKSVGGVSNSKHLTGEAVDLQLSLSDQKKLKLSERWKGGYGIGKTFCHLDIGRKRRWFY